MKKLVTILLAILACFTITACNQTGPSVIPPPADGGQNTEQGGTEEGDRVVTPIRPGGDFNGDGYGK